MKTMIAIVLLIGLVGCESEETHQHHLYNIQTCAVDGLKVARTLGNDDDVATRKTLYRQAAIECVAATEHTTTQFQLDKHDDYLENYVDFTHGAEFK